MMAITKLTTAVTVKIISMIGFTKSYVCSNTITNPRNTAARRIRILSMNAIICFEGHVVNLLFLFLLSQISGLRPL